jgi:hypothetical protein
MDLFLSLVCQVSTISSSGPFSSTVSARPPTVTGGAPVVQAAGSALGLGVVVGVVAVAGML